jgi:antitoxin (DNA-binding transcriptional repressor) of toxin-antitoxin stability system
MIDCKKPTMQFAVEDDSVTLAEMVSRAIAGEDVVITEAGVPVARVTPIPSPERTIRKRTFGTERGSLLYMADDFDAPLEDFAEYS